jgi:hypothetical protein
MARGFTLLPMSGNHYADLAACFDPAPDMLARLREGNILYDGDAECAFFQLYSRSHAGGMFFEIVERRGGYPWRNCVNNRRSVHIHVSVFGTAFAQRLITRMYFGDEEAANAADPVLTLIEQAHRRQTLVARADGNRYHFDIRLHGDDETVLFDL